MMIRIVSMVLVALLAVLPFVTSAVAQDRATMSAPIIRSTPDGVSFTVRFQNFAEGRSYRVGFGSQGEQAPNVTLELLKEEQAFAQSPISFAQGNTSGWWGVEQVASRGYALGPEGLPDPEEALTFRVTMPRDVADRYEKLYLFVSRNYGSDRWYMEDGSEIDKTDW